MILIMKILLHNEYKIINLWYPTYMYQFFNFPYNYKNRVLACFQTRPYQFECPLCGDQHEGSTSRVLFIRISEHAGRSRRTGRRLQNERQSNIRSHCEQECHAPVSISNFPILDSSNSNASLRILESLYIFKNKPKLNQTDSAFLLKIVP